MNNLRYVLLSAAALLILSACSSGPEAPSIDPTQGIEMLAGVYTTEIAELDIKNFPSSDPDLDDNIGFWRITLKDDGDLEVTLDGQLMADGNYEVTGDRIKVYLDHVCEDCDCAGSIGRYAWGVFEDKAVIRESSGQLQRHGPGTHLTSLDTGVIIQ